MEPSVMFETKLRSSNNPKKIQKLEYPAFNCYISLQNWKKKKNGI